MSLFGPACVGCGCTENNACMTADGPCSWVSLDPPLCSCCQEGEVGPPEIAEEACPAATTTAPHALIYTGNHDCYCARCRMKFAA